MIILKAPSAFRIFFLLHYLHCSHILHCLNLYHQLHYLRLTASALHVGPGFFYAVLNLYSFK